ncbi:MAG: hypothetical protein QOI75_6816, partial [Pseudonocardiales bacterium]|nr:hypothetical protein [Pseudonocardiales bacterium]
VVDTVEALTLISSRARTVQIAPKGVVSSLMFDRVGSLARRLRLGAHLGERWRERVDHRTGSANPSPSGVGSADRVRRLRAPIRTSELNRSLQKCLPRNEAVNGDSRSRSHALPGFCQDWRPNSGPRTAERRRCAYPIGARLLPGAAEPRT